MITHERRRELVLPLASILSNNAHLLHFSSALPNLVCEQRRILVDFRGLLFEPARLIVQPLDVALQRVHSLLLPAQMLPELCLHTIQLFLLVCPLLYLPYQFCQGLRELNHPIRKRAC